MGKIELVGGCMDGTIISIPSSNSIMDNINFPERKRKLNALMDEQSHPDFMDSHIIEHVYVKRDGDELLEAIDVSFIPRYDFKEIRS